MKVPTELAKVDSVGLIESGYMTYYDYSTIRRTASGMRFDRNKLFVAYYPSISKEQELSETHKQMIKRKNSYLGKEVLITSEFGSVICKVEDCGEFKEGQYRNRNIVCDASPALFKALGGIKSKGKLKVTIQLL